MIWAVPLISASSEWSRLSRAACQLLRSRSLVNRLGRSAKTSSGAGPARVGMIYYRESGYVEWAPVSLPDRATLYLWRSAYRASDGVAEGSTTKPFTPPLIPLSGLVFEVRPGT